MPSTSTFLQFIGENDLLQRTLFTCEDSYNSRFVGIEYIVDEYYTVEVERLLVRMYQYGFRARRRY